MTSFSTLLVAKILIMDIYSSLVSKANAIRTEKDLELLDPSDETFFLLHK